MGEFQVSPNNEVGVTLTVGNASLLGGCGDSTTGIAGVGVGEIGVSVGSVSIQPVSKARRITTAVIAL